MSAKDWQLKQYLLQDEVLLSLEGHLHLPSDDVEHWQQVGCTGISNEWVEKRCGG